MDDYWAIDLFLEYVAGFSQLSRIVLLNIATNMSMKMMLSSVKTPASQIARVIAARTSFTSLHSISNEGFGTFHTLNTSMRYYGQFSFFVEVLRNLAVSTG